VAKGAVRGAVRVAWMDGSGDVLCWKLELLWEGKLLPKPDQIEPAQNVKFWQQFAVGVVRQSGRRGTRKLT
jgi:hypothetical protein